MQAGEISDEKGIPIISTGDLCDFISEKNLEVIKEFTSVHKGYYAPGNHDFRVSGGMEFDTPEVRKKSFDKVQKSYPNTLASFSFVINGVNFVLLDDVYYRFEKHQIDFLKNEVAKGLPVVIAMHIPFYEEGLYIKTSRNLQRHASLVCVPRDKMTCYKPERIEQQIEDEPTREMFDYILSEPMIKCLLTGHSHKDHEAMLSGNLMQFTTGLNTIRKIKFY